MALRSSPSSLRRRGGGAVVPATPAVLSVLLATLALFAPGAAVARELDRNAPIEITADAIEYDGHRQLYAADGHVRVLQADRTIDADWIAFNRATSRGVATGDVVIVEGEEVLRADFVELELDSGEGVLFEGGLDTGEGGFRVSAAELAKTGEDTYSVEDATFTTCRCPEAEDRVPWELEASRGDVEVGGYGTARSATAEILGVPVFWLPWVFFPVKTERETGLLFPRVSLGGGNGVGGGLPFFWAARDELNVIVTPNWFTKRGFKPELEVEYVMGERSGGQLYGTFVRDRDVDPGSPRTPFDRERWAVRAEQDHDLPGGLRARSDVVLVSDNQLVRDFNAFGTWRSQRFVESRVLAFRHFGDAGASGLVGWASYVDDQQNPDDIDRDPFELQRWPALSFTQLPTPLPDALPGGLVVAFDADYVRFDRWRPPEEEIASAPQATREQFLDIGIDGSTRFPNAGIPVVPGFGNGVFDEGEPLTDHGSRVLLHPRLSRPLRLGDAVAVLPEIGWQQTLYSTAAQDFAERGLLTARLDVRTQLARELDLPGLRNGLHLLEPRLGWALVSSSSQEGNPLLLPGTVLPQARVRQLALDNVVRDPADRVRRRNVVTLGAANRFYAAAREGGPGRLRADLTASADYDFSRGGLGDFVLDGRTYPVAGVSTRFNLAVDLERGRFDEGLAQAGYRMRDEGFLGGSSFVLRYRYLRDRPRFFESFLANRNFDDFRDFEHVSQVDSSLRLQLGDHWALTHGISYSLDQSIVLSNRGAVEYVSRCRCWAIQVELVDSRDRGPQVNFRYTLLGLGDDVRQPFSGATGVGSRDVGGLP